MKRLLLLVPLVISCTTEPTTPMETGITFNDALAMVSDSFAQSSERFTEEDTLLALVNAFRTEGVSCGDTYKPPVEPVQWGQALADIAKDHSQDMVEREFFSHTNPDGESPWDRMANAGYEQYTAGENIASGQTSASAVMEAWIGSPGHCSNIMAEPYTVMGYGRVVNDWTQLFANPK